MSYKQNCSFLGSDNDVALEALESYLSEMFLQTVPNSIEETR